MCEAVRHSTVSSTVHLSRFDFTASESERSAQEVSVKGTVHLQHNKGESKYPSSEHARALEA